ncbi:MAG: glycosyl hydrolase family 28-related protein [Kiritimatiellales bacterium]|jgi:hypothetical protein
MKTSKQVKLWMTCISIIVLGTAGFATLNVCVTNSPYNAKPGDGGDDSAAFSSALTSIVSGGGGTLAVPAGKYTFSSRKAIDLKGATVAIAGSGKGVSRLECTNAAGIWWFNNTANANQLSISNLSFIAAYGGGRSSGTAIQINHSSLCSTAVTNLRMEHVGFNVAAKGDYFSKHIYTSYLQSPVFIDVLIVGSTNSESGFRINYGNNAYFNNCYCWSAGLGFTLSNYKGCVFFDRCNAVGNNTGFDVSAIAAGYCTADLLQVHANTRTNNIMIKNADEVDIVNAASYVDAVVTPFTDFIIDNCGTVNISGCSFHAPYDPIRTNICLKGSAPGAKTVKHNIFNTCFGWSTNSMENPDPAYLAAVAPYCVNGKINSDVTPMSGVTGVENIDTPDFDH